jgi:hypothetical protein
MASAFTVDPMPVRPWSGVHGTAAGVPHDTGLPDGMVGGACVEHALAEASLRPFYAWPPILAAAAVDDQSCESLRALQAIASRQEPLEETDRIRFRARMTIRASAKTLKRPEDDPDPAMWDDQAIAAAESAYTNGGVIMNVPITRPRLPEAAVALFRKTMPLVGITCEKMTSRRITSNVSCLTSTASVPITTRPFILGGLTTYFFDRMAMRNTIIALQGATSGPYVIKDIPCARIAHVWTRPLASWEPLQVRHTTAPETNIVEFQKSHPKDAKITDFIRQQLLGTKLTPGPMIVARAEVEGVSKASLNRFIGSEATSEWFKKRDQKLTQKLGGHRIRASMATVCADGTIQHRHLTRSVIDAGLFDDPRCFGPFRVERDDSFLMTTKSDDGFTPATDPRSWPPGMLQRFRGLTRYVEKICDKFNFMLAPHQKVDVLRELIEQRIDYDTTSCYAAYMLPLENFSRNAGARTWSRLRPFLEAGGLADEFNLAPFQATIAFQALARLTLAMRRTIMLRIAERQQGAPWLSSIAADQTHTTQVLSRSPAGVKGVAVFWSGDKRTMVMPMQHEMTPSMFCGPGGSLIAMPTGSGKTAMGVTMIVAMRSLAARFGLGRGGQHVAAEWAPQYNRLVQILEARPTPSTRPFYDFAFGAEHRTMEDLLGPAAATAGPEPRDASNTNCYVRGTALVVCPAALVGHWKKHISMIVPGATVKSPSIRSLSVMGEIQRVLQSSDVIIVTPTLLSRVSQTSFQLILWDVVIMDEAHRVNPRVWPVALSMFTLTATPSRALVKEVATRAGTVGYAAEGQVVDAPIGAASSCIIARLNHLDPYGDGVPFCPKSSSIQVTRAAKRAVESTVSTTEYRTVSEKWNDDDLAFARDLLEQVAHERAPRTVLNHHKFSATQNEFAAVSLARHGWQHICATTRLNGTIGFHSDIRSAEMSFGRLLGLFRESISPVAITNSLAVARSYRDTIRRSGRFRPRMDFSSWREVDVPVVECELCMTPVSVPTSTSVKFKPRSPVVFPKCDHRVCAQCSLAVGYTQMRQLPNKCPICHKTSETAVQRLHRSRKKSSEKPRLPPRTLLPRGRALVRALRRIYEDADQAKAVVIVEAAEEHVAEIATRLGFAAFVMRPGMTRQASTRAVHKFMEFVGPSVFVGRPKILGIGVDLVGIKHVVDACPFASESERTQAHGRVLRLGSLGSTVYWKCKTDRDFDSRSAGLESFVTASMQNKTPAEWIIAEWPLCSSAPEDIMVRGSGSTTEGSG